MTPDRFDPDDIAQICSRKKTCYRMTKSDYKELGKTALLGIPDLACGLLKAGVLLLSALPVDNMAKPSKTHELDGVYGDVRYVNGVRVDS